MHKQKINRTFSSQKFHKSKPSLYKLTSIQVQQLINYLNRETTQEEIKHALKYISHCPYCHSRNFYRIYRKSNLYRCKCEGCNKEFNILSRSSRSPVFRDESIKYNKISTYYKSLKDIEVWLHFDINYDRKFNPIPRKNIVSRTSRWKHNILRIPQDLKKII